MLQEVRRVARRLLGPDEQELLAGGSLQYSYVDLAAATDGFRIERRLGAGAAGAVYRGVLRGGTEVAVKVLEAQAEGAGGMGGFEEELRVLSRFRHPNLVTLLGWGEAEADSRTKFLVYELMPGGDLCQRLLRSQSGAQPFVWQQRFRVALDAACGLSYMVNSTPRAFHRDIKPPNILLDAHGTAKMADFGLAATIRKPGQGHLTVEQISGTPGYADPAYVQSGRVTEQSEVYSFGTVLLEMLLNERAALLGPRGEVLFPLVQIVQPAAPGALERILARLEVSAGWASPSKAADFAAMALSCVGRAETRPLFEGLFRQLRLLSQGPTLLAARPSAWAVGAPPPEAVLLGAAAALDATRRVPVWGERALLVPDFVRHTDFSVCDTWGKAAAAKVAGLPDVEGSAVPPAEAIRPRCSLREHAADESRLPSTKVCGRPPATAARNLVAFGGSPAEVVLEALASEGCDLAALAGDRRTLALAVSCRGSVVVGRQQQPAFFESLLTSGGNLGLISRAHLELSWAPGVAGGAAAVLRRLSNNALLVDGRALEREEAVPVHHGSTVSFCGLEGAVPFLVLRLQLRSLGEVAAAGPHPSLARLADETVNFAMIAAPTEEPAAVPGGALPLAVAFLECGHVQGREASELRWLAPGLRALPLLAVGQAVELGRLRQHGFFEQLLCGDSSWLAFVSRSHCRVTLQPPTEGLALATVENLSGNVVLVGGVPLARGQSTKLLEGGSLTFIARRPTDLEGPDVEFLRLVLRASTRDGRLPEAKQASTIVRL